MELENKFVDMPDYEGIYQVSTYGIIKSVERIVDTGYYKKTKPESIITPRTQISGGYLYVRLYKNGNVKTYKVHQVVAMAFLGHKPNGLNLVVNHIDKNVKNNRVDNLEIVSIMYNSNCHKETQGVTKKGNLYYARVTINKKRVDVGYFKTREEAIDARNLKMQEIDTFIPIRYNPIIP
jgi:hypothetical protein